MLTAFLLLFAIPLYPCQTMTTCEEFIVFVPAMCQQETHMFTASVQEECMKDVKYVLSRAFRLLSSDFYLLHPISVLTPPSLAGWRPSVCFPHGHIDFSSRLSLSGCTCVKRRVVKGDYTLSVGGLFFIASFVLASQMAKYLKARVLPTLLPSLWFL